MTGQLSVVVLGLSITSAWGNHHAVTYRALVGELCRRGHQVVFLERDLPWYAANRDLPRPPFGRLSIYRNLRDLRARFTQAVRSAHLVIVGSNLVEGAAVARWVAETARGIRAFYDLDPARTLSGFADGATDPTAADAIRRFELFLSAAGGSALERLERESGVPMARVLYPSVDPACFRPMAMPVRWAMGYVGNYSPDHQPHLSRLMVETARALSEQSFVVAGGNYPAGLGWPANIARVQHLYPGDQAAFHSGQRFALVISRPEAAQLGFTPSARLFEAAACGLPVVTDAWSGLETLLAPGREVLAVSGAAEVAAILADMPEERRAEIAAAGRKRVLADHTAERRVADLETYLAEVVARRRVQPRRPAVALARAMSGPPVAVPPPMPAAAIMPAALPDPAAELVKP